MQRPGQPSKRYKSQIVPSRRAISLATFSCSDSIPPRPAEARGFPAPRRMPWVLFIHSCLLSIPDKIHILCAEPQQILLGAASLAPNPQNTPYAKPSLASRIPPSYPSGPYVDRLLTLFLNKSHLRSSYFRLLFHLEQNSPWMPEANNPRPSSKWVPLHLPRISSRHLTSVLAEANAANANKSHRDSKVITTTTLVPRDPDSPAAAATPRVTTPSAVIATKPMCAAPPSFLTHSRRIGSAAAAGAHTRCSIF